MAKGSDRRTHFLKSAAQVFLELGYDATSMNLIAERAGVTKPGLYYHFESKADLLFSIMSYAMDVIEKHTMEATVGESDSEARLRRIVHNHARTITEEEGGAFTILVIDEANALRAEDFRIINHRKRAYFGVIRGLLEDLDRQGRLRDTDTTVAAFSLLGTVMWITKWYRPDGALKGEDVARQVAELALASVLREAPLPAGIEAL